MAFPCPPEPARPCQFSSVRQWRRRAHPSTGSIACGSRCGLDGVFCAVKMKIRSTNNLRKITKAMKMVASSKLKLVETQLIAARPGIKSINTCVFSAAPLSFPVAEKRYQASPTSLYRSRDCWPLRLRVALADAGGLTVTSSRRILSAMWAS